MFIDGLLHHVSELSIEEHYTDTAGYTDQVFGLSHILGFRFTPRMRDLSDSKLYVMDKSNDYSKIDSILRGKINIRVIQENYDDVLTIITFHTGRKSISFPYFRKVRVLFLPKNGNSIARDGQN